MNGKGSIYRKLIGSYFIIIVLVLTVVTAYLTSVQMRQIKAIVDDDIRDLSMNISLNPMIISCFEEGKISDEAKEYLDVLNENSERVDYIVLANTESIRIYHTDEELIGAQFQGGDEGPALEGAEPYITDGVGTRESQRRAFRTVYGDNGEILGFIMVSASAHSIMFLQNDEIIKYFTIYIVALIIGNILLWTFSKKLYKSLLGFEPSKLSSMYLQREDVLDTLSEGLLLIDAEGNCEYKNPSADRLMGITDEFEGMIRLEDFIEKYVRPNLDRPLPILREAFNQGERYLLMDLLPVPGQNAKGKILVILNDRTENMRLAEELTGVQHILEALRTATHENRNKLHVIYGLLQTGATEEAVSFISDSVSEDEDNLNITEAIRDKTVAALVIGKKRRAKELDIAFQLLKGSFLEKENPYLPSLAIVTIIGNLIENSYEAINEEAREREVTLYINSGTEGLSIIVDDTGIGMDAETVEQILKTSYTTKGEGHGTGFTLIRNIIREYGGHIDIESEPGFGSSISIAFQKKGEYK